MFSTIAIGLLISPSQHSFAKYRLIERSSTKQPSDQQKLLKQAFKDFCFIYYHDGKDKEEDQDTRVCQHQSSAFASLLLDESPKGSKQWAIQNSLHDLALQERLSTKDKTPIQSQRDFANSITNEDLKALISGSGDAREGIPQDTAFLPTLWDFKATSGTSSKPNEIPSGPTPSPQSTTPGRINVTCRFTSTGLVCTVN